MIPIEDKIKDICNYYYNPLMSLQNVIGVGLGYKHSNKVETYEPCIHVLVEKKLPLNCICSNNIVPESYIGLKTDVIEIGKHNFKKSLKNPVIPDRVRPLVSGCAISLDYSGDSGTLGCIVTKGLLKKSYYILSNNHIIADCNQATSTSVIIQPSKTLKGISPQDDIAILKKYVPLLFSSKIKKPVNIVDCAIAKILDSTLVSPYIYGSRDKFKGTKKAIVGMPVKKVGFTSGYSVGKVISLSVTINVDFEKGRLGLFKDQILANMPFFPGDSGSVISTINDNKIIGLGFAEYGNDHVIANDIKEVLNALKVDIYTG